MISPPVPQAPLQKVHSELFPKIRLWIKRDDLLHPEISGNKYRKLASLLTQLQTQARPQQNLLSMGGAWSNHLHALAFAAQQYGIPVRALVRGEVPQQESACLQDCRRWGMEIIYISRENYRRLRDEADYWQTYAKPNTLWLPEGGSRPEALSGVAQLVEECKQSLGALPDTILLACGTGATLAGVVAGMQGQGRVIGVAAIKNGEYLNEKIAELMQNANFPAYRNFQLLNNFHHGGYAKTTPELIAFCRRFIKETAIPIEPIYTGKMLYALHQLCMEDFFKEGEQVIAVHTGGLQGLRGKPIDGF